MAVYIYKISQNFPSTETYGLTSQIRRSATSVAANIAEGFSRASQKDKAHFYTIALGSLTETLSHAYIATDLNFIKTQELSIIEEKIEILHKMINGMIKKAPGRIA
jgi:four helix bundle protein